MSVGWPLTAAGGAQEALLSMIDVHSAATAGIVNVLIAKEAIRTAILLMIELRKVELLRGELQFCGSMFYCARVAPSTTVVAPAEPWLSGGGSREARNTARPRRCFAEQS